MLASAEHLEREGITVYAASCDIREPDSIEAYLDGLADRTRAATRRWAWDWAWGALSRGLALDFSRPVTAPCRQLSEGLTPLGEGERPAAETWVLLAVLKGRLGHLRRWTREGGTGDHDGTWGRLLGAELPAALRDQGGGYDRLRAWLSGTLEDTLEDWMPGVHPRAADITVEMLLVQTAGLPGALGTSEAQADPSRTWTEDELFALVADDPLVHEPGADWGYSNTHYMLLARIAQAAGGAPWRQLMQERLLDPLGLAATRVPAIGEGWGDVTGYWGDDPYPDATRTQPESIGGAGNMISTALDVARWGQARFGGGLHSEATTELQTSITEPLQPGIEYGLGLMVLDTAGGDDIGHNGALGGFATWVGHRPDADVTLSLLCNAWGANPTNVGYPLGLAQDDLWEVME